MVISLFESIKYAGHLWPVALLRISLGVFFLKSGLQKVHSDFLNAPLMIEQLNKWMSAGAMSPHYTQFVQNWVSPHWRVFSHALVFGELFIGVSFILGFMVRPASLIALILSANFIMAGGDEVLVVNKLLIYVTLVLYLTSAGRCVGFDYYFYKRIRGIWW